MADSTCVSASLTTKVAPSGNFTVAIVKSNDGGATFPTTIATITITAGNKVGTTTTTQALVVGDLLSINITAVNGAADWNAQLYIN